MRKESQTIASKTNTKITNCNIYLRILTEFDFKKVSKRLVK